MSMGEKRREEMWWDVVDGGVDAGYRSIIAGSIYN
jgi:hypothetical protein